MLNEFLPLHVAQDEGAEMSFVELVRLKIFRSFIVCFLHLLGELCPEFVNKMIDEMHLPERQSQIIRLRYLHGFKFEAIPDMVHCELRNVFKLHKEYIDQLAAFVIAYKKKS